VTGNPARRRGLRRLLAGTGSLLLLLAIIGGVPLILVAIGAVPRRLPSADQLWTSLSTQDDGRLAFVVIAGGVWLCWGLFTALTLREARWAIRQRASLRAGAVVPAARPLPGLGAFQHPAAGLVAAAAMLFVAGPDPLAAAGSAAVTSPAAAVDTYSGLAQPGTSIRDPAPAHDLAMISVAARQQAALPTYTVRVRDTLWRIASKHLGDPLRYHDIVAINPGKIGPDNRIIAGAVLVMPADATGLAPTSPATGTREVIVRAGDTLSGIAELAGVSDWRRVWHANAGRAQPGGDRFSDPDLIKPGWQLTIPSIGAVPPTKAPASPPTKAPTTTQAPTPPPPTSGQHLDRLDRPETAPAPAMPITPQAPATADELGLDDTSQSFPLRTTTGVGALLAAGIIGLIAARRGRQQRRRQPSRTIPTPVGKAAEVERELRAIADPLSVETVDLALRCMAASCSTDGQPLPVVRAGRLTAEQFDLHLAEPAELPAPWQGTADAAVWTLPAGADPLPEVDVRQVPAPYPSLVTIGHDSKDAHVFLDLEYLGALCINGDPQRTREIMAALAIELATSRWADDLQITLVGAYPELGDVLETGRIRYVPAAGHILDELVARASRDQAILAASDARDLNHARATRTAPGVWTPEIVLLAGGVTDDERVRLTQLVRGLPRVAIATITSGEPTGEWCLRLDGDDAVLEPAGLRLHPQRIDDDTYGHLLDILDTTSADDETAQQGGEAIAEPTLADLMAGGEQGAGVEEDLAVPETADGRLRPLPHRAPRIVVLGPVDVVDARGAVEPSKRNRLTELAAFLALNPGVDHAAIDAALWPGSRVGHNTRNTAMSKLRRWLGVDSDGEDHLPRYQAEAGYQLGEQVTTDWQAWCDLLPQGPQQAPTETLEQSLTLVSGRPFDGVGTRRYAWAENAKQMMVSAVVDAAYELARRRLMEGRWRAAEQAIVVGLTLEPGMERLWRIRIMAAHSSGNPAAEKEAIDRLLAIADELGGDLEPETERLLEQLRRPTTSRDHRVVRAL